MRRDDVFGFEDGTTERYNIECVKCLEDYKNSQNYIVKRLDPFARVKEKCDKCEGYGYDYLVIERSKEGH